MRRWDGDSDWDRFDWIHGVGGLGIRGLATTHAQAIRVSLLLFFLLPFEGDAVRRIGFD